MKKSILFFLLLSMHLSSHAQGGIWTWVKGDTTGGANIGAIGVTNAANYPIGRYQAGQWKDLNGNFWIFGGNARNDLWKYDPATNIWTWVNGTLNTLAAGVYGTKGIASPNNMPGARNYGMHTWTDLQGRLWLSGGLGVDRLGGRGSLDDLWMYDIPTNQWTWMAGSDTADPHPHYGTKGVAAVNNTPGGRSECNTTWVKSDGTLWTFGGQYMSTNSACTDMWMYDPGTNMWTWMSGDSALNTHGNYGVLNVESATNLPPSRWGYTHWQDNDNFYIFGGFGLEEYDDIWKYNTSNNRWTWLGGITTNDNHGLYLQTCSYGGNKLPAARFENRTCQTTDCSKLFWTFGGVDRFDNNFNDLWNFNIQTGEWRWVSGDSTTNSPGHYGTMGIPSASDLPAARNGFCFWADDAGALWLWGGDGQSPCWGAMWKFVPDTSCIHPITQATPTISRVGNTLTASAAAHYQWQYNGTDITGDTMASITATQVGTYTVVVSNNSGCSASASVNVIKTGISEMNDALHIRIYPSPNSGSFTLNVPESIGSNYTIYDMLGRQIQQGMITAETLQISISGNADGVYTLAIHTAASSAAIRFTVVK